MSVRRCPRCGDDMLRMYRRRRSADVWEWVWLCLTCRKEVIVLDEA